MHVSKKIKDKETSRTYLRFDQSRYFYERPAQANDDEFGDEDEDEDMDFERN